MSKRVLVRGARQLVTLHGPAGPHRGGAMRDLAIIADGAILIEDGLITQIGPSRRLENLREARSAVEVNAAGRVVMPGFVDSHTHLIGGPPLVDDYPVARRGYRGAVLENVRAVRRMTKQRMTAEARQNVRHCIRHGTTTLESKSGYGLDETTERKMLRALSSMDEKPLPIVLTYLGAHVIPPEFTEHAADYADWICRHMLPQIRRRRLANFVDVVCDADAFPPALARRILAAAASLGLPTRITTDQSAHSGGVRLAVEVGAISVDHLAFASREDVDLLGRSATMATLLPGAVFHAGLSRYAPARPLIDAGAAVALATDFSPATSPTCSMPMILSLACTNMKMTPAEAITAATLNGAHAIGCAHRAGSLEVGKDADLIMLTVPDYRELPCRFGMNLVAMVMSRGEPLYPRLGTA